MFVMQLHQLHLNICLIPLSWDCVSTSTLFCGTLIVDIVQKFAAIFTFAICVLQEGPVIIQYTTILPAIDPVHESSCQHESHHQWGS